MTKSKNRRGHKYKPLPLKHELRESFEYEQSTGQLLWKCTKITRLIGKPAGYYNNARKRFHVNYRRSMYSAHRLIWAYHFGDPGNITVDHKDRNPTNNRIENLRLASAIQQKYNQSRKGYCFDKQCGRWRARIGVDGKEISLGLFDSEVEAAEAYNTAAKELHGEFFCPSSYGQS